MKRVLVVEDYPSLQYIYKVALESAGYEVDTASDGGEAIDMVKKNKYDAILLDLLLQRVSGLEFLRNLNAPLNFPELKILVISNLSHPEVAKEAQRLGVSKFFVKSEHLPKEIVKHVSESLEVGK